MSKVLEFVLLQSVLLAVVLVLHTYIGLHIIRRGIIFCDLVLDQLAALGMVVGVGLGMQYGTGKSYILALIAVIIGSWLLAVVKSKNPLISQETIIGIMYAFALIALLLLADKIPQGGTYVTKTLAGSMMWASWKLVGVTVGVYAVLIFFHFKYRREFIGLSDVAVEMPRKAMWEFFFFATQGVITVLIVPVSGVLLAYGLLMIPAAIGAMFTRGWASGIIIGWLVGFPACVTGLLCSYSFDWPYGPSLLLCMGVCFLGAAIGRVAWNCRLEARKA